MPVAAVLVFDMTEPPLAAHRGCGAPDLAWCPQDVRGYVRYVVESSEPPEQRVTSAERS